MTGLGTWLAPIPRTAQAAGSVSSPTVTATPGNRRAASTGEIQHNLKEGDKCEWETCVSGLEVSLFRHRKKYDL